MRPRRSDSAPLGSPVKSPNSSSIRSPANHTDAPNLEEETTDDTDVSLREVEEEVNRTPEENKNPSIRRVENAASDLDKTDSFTPPPALSPAYSIQEQEEEGEEVKDESLMKIEKVSDPDDDDEEEQEEQKPKVEEKKVENRPKMKYKRRAEKDKDAVPFIDPNGPKRNRSAYVHFIVHRRASYSKTVMSQRDINIALAADWQKLSADERVPFHQKAEEEKKKYIELMEEYKKTESHKEFQKKRAKFLSTQSTSKQRKRKHDGDSDDDDVAGVQMAFPKPNVFCPLMNTTQSAPSSSTSVQYLGPIFTPEFMSYNKTRDSYRRQLAVERSNVEHELEALNQYDIEIRIQKQEDRLQSVDAKIEDTMAKMRSMFGGVNGAKEHLGSIDDLTDWLGSVTRLGQNHATKKSVKETINKHAKAIIALRK